MITPAPSNLLALRGLRTAPVLSKNEAIALAEALQEAMNRCEWFTVGVMAASADEARTSLRSIETSMGWQALAESSASEADDSTAQAAGVFLKGNQSTGLFSIRQEAGLGEGILISGHNTSDPDGEDTWGPFPLEFFA